MQRKIKNSLLAVLVVSTLFFGSSSIFELSQINSLSNEVSQLSLSAEVVFFLLFEHFENKSSKKRTKAYTIVPHLEPVQRLAYTVAWIIFYFLLICVVSGYDFLLWFTQWSFFLTPSTLLLFGGSALVLGLTTDHFCHTLFDWYTTRSFEVSVMLLVLLTGLGSVVYNSWYIVPEVGPPSFEKLAVTDACDNSVNDLAVVVENVGNVEANITDVFVNGEPVSSMNGIISSPRIPFVLKKGGVETVRLSFSSPLSQNVNYEVSIRTRRGSNYTGTVTIP